MKHTFRNLAIAACSLLAATSAKADGIDIAVDFSDGATYYSDKTATSFAINSKSELVAADDADAVVVISGTRLRGDSHGIDLGTVTIKADGPVDVVVGGCQYGADFTLTDGGSYSQTAEKTDKCYHEDKSAVAFKYTGEATTLTLTGGKYLPFISVKSIATGYSNVEAEISWAIGNESKANVSEAVANAVLQTSKSVGTDLNATLNGAYASLNIAAETMVLYQPSTSNAGCVPTDMVEYKVKLRKGLLFTPSSVEFDAVKEGTDGAYFSWSVTADGVESAIAAYSTPKTQIRRNNNNNPDAPITHVEAVSTDPCRSFTLRLYISNVASDKKMAISNIKIKGTVSGEVEVRNFVDFKVDLRSETPTVLAPSTGVLPEGVAFDGKFHDGQHGYSPAKFTIPVDGPVRLTIGTCQYGSTTTIKDAEGTVLATVDGKTSCDTDTSFDNNVSWVYNSEDATTLTVEVNGYIPYFYAEACELLPNVNVQYFDANGTTLLDEETVLGGTALKYLVDASKVTVAEGKAFRGWFNSPQASAVKVLEGTSIQDDLKLYAHTTDIEVPTSTSRFIYEINKKNFYVEDHEAIEMTGKFHDTTHGWDFSNGQSIKVKVAGKSYISLGLCQYSSDSEATITDAAGNELTKFNVKAAEGSDGASYTYKYDGEAGDVTITFSKVTYVHKVTVYNVVDFVNFDETTGYYLIPAGDVSSFLIALTDANSCGNRKIFLPNGTYDLGETVLTPISGENISIIGESMEGTIIRNAPAVENEGIGTTATLYNTSKNLYLQDLTIQNALEYYKSGGAGRAVCLQDKGSNTICKNVRMLSYQDTYYSNAASPFYWEDCEIHGTVDYLCGDGDVVYNRCLFVNESRKQGTSYGDCTIAAPYTSESCQWGYVMMNCSVKTLSATFNLGRAWGGKPRLAYLNTTIEKSKLASSRFTIAGMNVAADKFVEYHTMDVDGTVISPESNKIKFTHKSGNDNEIETILTDEQAAEYTIDNIYGAWAPDSIAAPVEVPVLGNKNGSYSWNAVENATAYLVYVDDKLVEILSAETTTYTSEGKVNVRAANGRGGFGKISEEATGIEAIVANQDVVSVEYFSLSGQKVSKPAKGMNIVKVNYSDGSSRNTKMLVK